MANNIKLNVKTNKKNVPMRTRDPAETPDITPIDKDPFYVGAKAVVEQTEYGAHITMEDKDGRTTADVYHGEKGEKGDKGDKGDTGSLPMYYDTCEGWNSQTTLVTEAGAIYVYTDYKQVGGVNVSGIKLGDGTSYLIDVPFQDAQFQEHILDNVRHITAEERAFWNSKNRALIMGENLVLTEL